MWPRGRPRWRRSSVWSVGSKPVDVYLGLAEGGFAVAGRPEGWAPHVNVDAAVRGWFAQARSSVGRGLRRRSVRVWLSGALARPFVWGPVQGLARWREAELAAQAAAPEATGLVGPCAVSLDEWSGSVPALVVAVERRVVTTIADAAKETGVRIVSMRPWWAYALEQQAREAAESIVVRDTDALTVLAVSDDVWRLAHSYVPRPSEEQTPSLLDRLFLSANLEGGSVQHVALRRDDWPCITPRLEEAAA